MTRLCTLYGQVLAQSEVSEVRTTQRDTKITFSATRTAISASTHQLHCKLTHHRDDTARHSHAAGLTDTTTITSTCQPHHRLTDEAADSDSHGHVPYYTDTVILVPAPITKADRS